MIGTMTPATRALDLRTRHPHTSDIDTVKAQERQERRKTQRGPPAVTFKRLMHIERMRELMRGAMTPVPVVKVTGHNQRRVGRHHALDALAQVLELAATTTRCQPQMHAHAMQRTGPVRYGNLGMQQSTRFETMRRYVLIFPAQNRKPRQDRVAMITVAVLCIATVDVEIRLGTRAIPLLLLLLPQLLFEPVHFCQKLVLRPARPVAMTMRVPVVTARHFLQKHHIGIQGAQLVAQRVYHHPLVEDRQALVDVTGGNAQAGFLRMIHGQQKNGVPVYGTP